MNNIPCTLSFWSLWSLFYCAAVLLRQNSSKHDSESTKRCCVWFTVSKSGTHLETSYRINKWSCKIVCTLPFNILRVSAISCNWLYDKQERFLWFLNVSWVTASFRVNNKSCGTLWREGHFWRSLLEVGTLCQYNWFRQRHRTSVWMS